MLILLYGMGLPGCYCEAMDSSFFKRVSVSVHACLWIGLRSLYAAFDYCLSMEFETNKHYDAYNNHPDHIKFVQTFWVNYVESFLELDYEAY